MASVPAPLPLSGLIAARLADAPYIVPAGMHLHHVHPSVFPANSFNPGGHGRFHPFTNSAGTPVPCLYAADSIAGSYTETVFRSIGEHSCRQVAARRIRQFSHALLAAGKELRLAHLSGDALSRLGLTRAALLEPGPAYYPATVRWAQAIHATYPDLHGLAWVSRQHDATTCFMLYGDRVASGELQVLSTIRLADAAGAALTDRVAMRLGIVVMR
jgi:RES domain